MLLLLAVVWGGHLTPRLRKEMLTGKRCELSKEEYQELTST
jgi:hypothetical protein